MEDQSYDGIIFDLEQQHSFRLSVEDKEVIKTLFATDHAALFEVVERQVISATQILHSQGTLERHARDFMHDVRHALESVAQICESNEGPATQALSAPTCSADASETSRVTTTTKSSKRSSEDALLLSRPVSPVAKRVCVETPSRGSLGGITTSTGSVDGAEPLLARLRGAMPERSAKISPVVLDPSDPFFVPPKTPPSIRSSETSPSTSARRQPDGLACDSIVPHHPRTSAFFERKLANAAGIQFELYRLSVAKWRSIASEERGAYPGVELAGLPPLDNCPNPHQVFLKLRPETLSGSIDKEALRDLDRELVALREGKGRAADPSANTDSIEPGSGWRYGRVHFKGDVSCSGDNFEVTLQPLSRGTSTADRRRFGSHRFLELRIKRLEEKEIPGFLDWSKRRHKFLGLVWQAFDFADNVLYLFGLEPSAGSPLSSLRDYLDFDGPFDDNGHVKVQKRTARLALTRSATQPILSFAAGNIDRGEDRLGVPDIIGQEAPDPKAAEACMTDGSGFASIMVFRRVQEMLGIDKVSTLPTTIQARVGTAIKGTWSLDPECALDDESLYIKVRQSQVKLRQPVDLDYSHSVLNLVTVARASCPAAVNFQVIALLVEKGVSRDYFLGLLRAQLDENFTDLMSWDAVPGESEDNLRRRLHRAYSRLGVMNGRLRREQGAASRASIGRKDDEEEDDTDGAVVCAYDGYGAELASPGGSCEAIARDPSSGQPKSLHETVLDLLNAGFLPKESVILAEKMYAVAKATLEGLAKKFHYTCPLSASAMIIPDPLGVLDEGEIFLTFSDPPTHPHTKERINVIKGPVLALRHPCLLPTDIQKVVAVDRPELHRWKNVIIMPTKGKRSMASLLAGGDYDGDRVMIIFDPEVVETFRPSTGEEARVSLDGDRHVKGSFSQSSETVGDFMARTRTLSPVEWEAEMQDQLLKAITIPRKHGVYSNWHVLSCYRFGASDPRSIRLAHITAQLLDAPKSGMMLKPSVEREDRREWGNLDMPDFHQWMKSVVRGGGPDKAEPKRARRLGEHPLAYLKTHGTDALNGYLARLIQEKEDVGSSRRPDAALVAPWEAFVERAASDADEAQDRVTIEGHVEAVLKAWESTRAKGPLSPSRKRTYQRQPSFTSVIRRADASLAGTDNIAAVALKFKNGPKAESFRSRMLRFDHDGSVLATLKALLAYKVSFGVRGVKPQARRFPWDVAFGELCAIKARSHPRGARPVVEPLYEAMAADKRMVSKMIAGST